MNSNANNTENQQSCKNGSESPHRTKRSAILSPIFDNIPDDLKRRKQWLVWSYTTGKDGKPTKVPYSPKTNQKASANDLSNCVTFDEAMQTYQRSQKQEHPRIPGHRVYSGVGYALSIDDGIFAGDLDKCVGEDGLPEPWAQEIVDRFVTYTELSASGTGIRFIGRGTPAFAEANGKRKNGQIELFSHGFFVTMTGHHIEGTPNTVEDRQDELDTFCSEFFPTQETASEGDGTKTEDHSSRLTDDRVLELARRAANHRKFIQLFEDGDISDYPSASEARLALLGILAFYSGRDIEQLDRLFRRSALMCPKWDSPRGTSIIGRMTIGKALETKTVFYTPPAPMSFPLTDMGNAERMAHRHGASIRYSYTQRQWYIYDGSRWRKDEGNEIASLAKETVRSMLGEADGIENDEKRKALVAWAQRSESRKAIEDMIDLCRSEPGITVREDEWDANPFLLNCTNGTVDLRTGELLPHRPEDMITKMARGAYDPADLERFEEACPIWRAFLRRVVPDKEVRVYIQQLVGYSATGDVSEQILLFLYGEGSNGKSTFLGTLQEALGDYARQAAPELLVAKDRTGSVSNDIADLRGARFVATVEVDDGKRLAEGLVKQITGGDKIKARLLYRDFFEFAPTHKIWLAANHKPVVRGTDNGIWRRIKLVPFTETIPDEEKDKQLPQKLRQEMSGIISWIVRGCISWHTEGLYEPEAVKAASKEYRDEMDILADFVEDSCLFQPTATITKGDLYKEYQSWCDENGLRPLSQKNLNRQLRSKYTQLEEVVGLGPRSQRGWKGILLKSDMSEYEMQDFWDRTNRSGTSKK
jgi:putative DNA primase/helicase